MLAFASIDVQRTLFWLKSLLNSYADHKIGDWVDDYSYGNEKANVNELH